MIRNHTLFFNRFKLIKALISSNFLRLFFVCVLAYGPSWRTFYECLSSMCVLLILQMLSGMLHVSQIQFVYTVVQVFYFLVYLLLNFLSIIKSGLLQCPHSIHFSLKFCQFFLHVLWDTVVRCLPVQKSSWQIDTFIIMECPTLPLLTFLLSLCCVISVQLLQLFYGCLKLFFLLPTYLYL